MTDNPKQITDCLQLEIGEALIVDSVTVHKTSGQIPKGYVQQVEFLNEYFHDNRIIDLNFPLCKFGSNFVGPLDNGVLVLKNYILYNFCYIVTTSVMTFSLIE